MSDQTEPTIEPFGFLAPPTGPGIAPAPTPDETWELNGGWAWVYHGDGNSSLTRPVLLSDGFETGPSSPDALWEGLERKDFAFIGELRRQRRDLVLIGYEDRSASLLRNAEVATRAVLRAVDERTGNAPLLVGGFSMGGLITRYALARLEHEGIDHQTGVYLSFDAPHRGAWVPIGLQALAHFLTATPALSRQINSPAARQLLWRHISAVADTPSQDPLRTEFLAELERVGGWPMRPRKLGVANGRGDGTGNGVPAGEEALKVTSGWFAHTALRTQSLGAAEQVAHLQGLLRKKTATTDGLPDLDGAPGGTLETFGIAGDRLKLTGRTEVAYRSVNFVPTISALSLRDLDRREDLYADIDGIPPEESDFDDFKFSATNTPHAQMSEELGRWVLDRLPHG
ncbi:hypothetical protein AB0P17_29000 [Streptomyces sp. NPDC088124]|uniref:esterase/lipase family protein n=1 Tax=Streptomyces sp. NPDC088124 TaxID=3154654 RepID=UPI003417FDA2